MKLKIATFIISIITVISLIVVPLCREALQEARVQDLAREMYIDRLGKAHVNDIKNARIYIPIALKCNGKH